MDFTLRELSVVFSYQSFLIRAFDRGPHVACRIREKSFFSSFINNFIVLNRSRSNLVFFTVQCYILINSR